MKQCKILLSNNDYALWSHIFVLPDVHMENYTAMFFGFLHEVRHHDYYLWGSATILDDRIGEDSR